MKLGSFVPRESLIHKVPSVWKFLIFLVLVVTVFITKSFTLLGVIAFAMVVTVILSKVGLGNFFRSMKPLLWFILFLGVLQFFMVKEGAVLFTLFGFPIYDQTLLIIARVTLRLIILTGLSLILTMTTSPIALAKGIETVGKPLAIIGFPVKDGALAFSIALRFIPVFLGEFQRIGDARRSRGFGSESFLQRLKHLTATIIPLLISSIQHAEELGNALEIRGYSISKKKKSK